MACPRSVARNFPENCVSPASFASNSVEVKRAEFTQCLFSLFYDTNTVFLCASLHKHWLELAALHSLQ